MFLNGEASLECGRETKQAETNSNSFFHGWMVFRWGLVESIKHGFFFIRGKHAVVQGQVSHHAMIPENRRIRAIASGSDAQ